MKIEFHEIQSAVNGYDRCGVIRFIRDDYPAIVYYVTGENDCRLAQKIVTEIQGIIEEEGGRSHD